MRVECLQSDEAIEEHIWSRHGVVFREVEEAAYHHGLVVRGRAKDLYEVYGRTEAGRYLMIAVRYLGKGVARLITARDMGDAERYRYRRYTAH